MQQQFVVESGTRLCKFYSNSRFANITTRELPLDTYADGKWYSVSKEIRETWKPVLISNNWIIGNYVLYYHTRRDGKKQNQSKSFIGWLENDQ